MKGFTNVQYTHRLSRGTREVGTLAPPKHAKHALGNNLQLNLRARQVVNKENTTALENVTQDMLQHVLEEPEYRLHVCRITGGAHIEHL